MSKARHYLVAVILVVALAACQGGEPQQPAAAGSSGWNSLVAQFVEDTFRAQPFFAVQSGRHEFDGRMPDLSRSGIDNEIARLNSARTLIAATGVATLSKAQAFEREYLLSVIDERLFWLAKAEWPARNPAWYANQLDPEVYLSRRYAPLETRLRGYIGYASSIPAIATAVRTNLRTPLPRSYVEYAIRAFGGYAAFYESDVPKVFATVADPELQRQLAEANGRAIAAMRDLEQWFVAQRKGANDGYALGPELFAVMLRDTEGVTMSVAEVEAAGRADMERNLAALTAACASYAPKLSVKACVAKVHAGKPSDGPVAGARRYLDTMREFVRSRGIVGIPSEEQAEVEESPPYNRQNSAYINIPGPYEKGVAYVYNISPPDPTWSKQQQRDYIDSEAELQNTTVHEVWPGHFLQFLHANRNPSLVGRLWVGYAYAEGWAHYAEQLMREEGWGGGAVENHIAQLLDALWRNARLLSAIGLHTKGMTVAESERLFMEKAFNDRGNAQQQAARGTYDPAYLNYTLGKLMIIKLRDDWVAKQIAAKPGVDAKSQWRAFHDAFLAYGGPPIPLVRRDMLGADSGPLL